MHRRVATSGPACPLAQQQRVIGVSNENLPGRLVLYLRVAFQAEVRIILHEQLTVNRTVGRMTNHAAFAQGFMLEHEWAALLAMTGKSVKCDNGDICRTAQEKRHKTETDRSSSRHSVAASFGEFAPCSCVAVA